MYKAFEEFSVLKADMLLIFFEQFKGKTVKLILATAGIDLSILISFQTNKYLCMTSIDVIICIVGRIESIDFFVFWYDKL